MLLRFWRVVLEPLFPLWLLYCICGVLGVLFVIPLLWPLLASINPDATLAFVFPEHPGLGNFSSLLTDVQVIAAFRTSFLLSGITMFIVVLCSLGAAYPLARYRSGWINKILFSLLISGFCSVFALILPLYALCSLLNLLNTLPGTIFFLIASVLPFSIWLMVRSFASIPHELEEAAMLDGSSGLTTFLHVILPLSLSDISFIALWSFLEAWTNFQIPFVLLQNSRLFPVPVQLYVWFSAATPVHYGVIAAYLVIYSIPAIIIYISLSRRFIGYVRAGFLDGIG